MPDYMHIVHLALAVDAIASVLIDLVDIDDLVAGATRDQKLATLWCNYHAWAEATRGFACDFSARFVCGLNRIYIYQDEIIRIKEDAPVVFFIC